MTYSVKLATASGAPRNAASVLLGYLRGEDTSERHLLGGGAFTKLNASEIQSFAEKIARSEPPGGLSTASGDTSFSAPVEAETATASASQPVTKRAGKPTVVLIDVGIAYWHTRFCREGESAFTKVGFFSASGQLNEGPSAASLNNKFQSKGNAAILSKLGAEFPSSIYASKRIADPAIRDGDFAHGTAMADFLLGEIEPQNWPNLVGYELPKSVFLDRSGATLREFLTNWLIPEALKEQDDPQTPLHIIVPYAFLGGPHSDDGPDVVRSLKALVTGKAVTLYFPTGNHLQDALHAQLPDVASGATSSPVTWRLPANDYSAAALELWWQGPADVSLTLTDPHGTNVDPHNVLQGDALKPDALGFAFSSDRITDAIVGIQRIKDADWHGLLVCIAPTRPPVDSIAAPAPAGDWTVQLGTSSGKITGLAGWVRRDDPIQISGLKLEAQQSWLVDPNYVVSTDNGQVPRDDTNAAQIRRFGSASMLTVGTDWTQRVIAGATEAGLTGETTDETALYTGRRSDGSYGKQVEVGTRGKPGLIALYNGSGRQDRLSGTSVAIAKCVNDVLGP